MVEVPSWMFWKHPEKLKASTWLLEVMLKPEVADTRPIFLIHHPELLAELKLADKGVAKSGLRYYTYNQISDADRQIREQAGKFSEIKNEARTPFQRQLLKLANVAEQVKKQYGGRDKLVDALTKALNRAKDQPFVAKLATFSLPRLYDLARAAERRVKAAAK